MTYATEQVKVGGRPVAVVELDLDTCALIYGKSFTNLLKRSEEFDHADWIKSAGAVKTVNAIKAPDGTLTAELLEDDDVGSNEFILQDVTVPDDTVTRTFSCFFKEGSAAVTTVVIQYRSVSTITHGLKLTWATRTVAVSGSPDDFGVEEISDGWVRVWVTVANNGAGNTTCRCIVWPAFDTGGADLGTCYAWGAQLVNGVQRGHYVKTVAASATKTCAGLAGQENLLTRSEQFDHADWITSVTVTANALTAPDGTLTAELLEDDDAGSVEAAYQDVTVPDDTVTRTFSCHLKQGTAAVTKFVIQYRDAATFTQGLSLTWASRTVVAAGSPVDFGIEAVGDDWYRVWVSVANSGTGNLTCRCIIWVANNEDVADLGTCYAWGAQLVVGAQRGSYYKTEATALTGTVGQECYNTRHTCQDTDNYTKLLKTYRHIEPIEGLPAGIDMIPSLTSISLAPSRITQDFGLGHRASVTLTLQDFPHHDRGIDPYVANRTYDPEAQGTYWGKLRARTPFYQGRTIRIRTGYITDPWDWDNFQDSEYVIEEMRRLDPGSIQIIAKDILKLASDERAVAPAPSKGELSIALGIADVTMSIVGGDYNDPVATGENEYVRIGDEIIQYTGRSGTGTSGDPWVLTGLVRTDTKWGSLGSAHAENDAVQLCKAWESVNVRTIIDELLVTYASISSSFITAADWDLEQSRWLSSYSLTAILSEPEGVSTLISELQEQCQLNILWDEVAKKILLIAIAPPLGNLGTALNSTSHILADTLKVKDRAKDRLSQVWLYYDKADYTEDDTKNYKRLYIQADTGAESDDQYGDQRIKVIESRWFNENNSGQAIQMAGRMLSTRKNIPRHISFSLDAKDEAGTKTGDIRDISHIDLQDPDGSALTTRVQIIEKKEAVPGHRYDYLAVSGVANEQFAFIGPNTLNDYLSETDANKQAYAFIAENTGLMSNGDEGYKII